MVRWRGSGVVRGLNGEVEYSYCGVVGWRGGRVVKPWGSEVVRWWGGKVARWGGGEVVRL